MGSTKEEEGAGDAEKIEKLLQVAQAKKKERKIEKIITKGISIIKNINKRSLNQKNICNDLILNILKLKIKLKKSKDKCNK